MPPCSLSQSVLQHTIHVMRRAPCPLLAAEPGAGAGCCDEEGPGGQAPALLPVARLAAKRGLALPRSTRASPAAHNAPVLADAGMPLRLRASMLLMLSPFPAWAVWPVLPLAGAVQPLTVAAGLLPWRVGDASELAPELGPGALLHDSHAVASWCRAGGTGPSGPLAAPLAPGLLPALTAAGATTPEVDAGPAMLPQLLLLLLFTRPRAEAVSVVPDATAPITAPPGVPWAPACACAAEGAVKEPEPLAAPTDATAAAAAAAADMGVGCACADCARVARPLSGIASLCRLMPSAPAGCTLSWYSPVDRLRRTNWARSSYSSCRATSSWDTGEVSAGGLPTDSHMRWSPRVTRSMCSASGGRPAPSAALPPSTMRPRLY
mmetsp:Transcript_26530/g.67506  ORF Transcript_26530/g.67506 Transcript_26530/m.67506 type:complete len:378 (-) Transcript_26530:641-1774(-)